MHLPAHTTHTLPHTLCPPHHTLCTTLPETLANTNIFRLGSPGHARRTRAGRATYTRTHTHAGASGSTCCTTPGLTLPSPVVGRVAWLLSIFSCAITSQLRALLAAVPRGLTARLPTSRTSVRCWHAHTAAFFLPLAFTHARCA